ncbi:hypothetical protein C8A01DRAFT_31662 [Parachaetomium inaequale]|uniref:Uncharacterized protein n=1 Tax=Parachaetomium inaequale TaxID=2588326 RepID=A0AAN6PT26_9PEZI|nr:hypothetical protein C8A01DRAFT_31662 [Parachaetomium inaequale]
MPTPRIHLTIDTPLLSTTSHDTLVLSRQVNGVFNTALAVASLNPRGGGDGSTTPGSLPLFAQNIFSWDGTNNNSGSSGGSSFRVAVSYSSSSSGQQQQQQQQQHAHGGALTASVTDAVEIGHGETVRFERNVLGRPVRMDAAATGGGSTWLEGGVSGGKGAEWGDEQD